jgi:hypothetical protein
MHKLNRVSMHAAAVALAVAFVTATSIAIAPPADAGSRNRDAFLKAAKKGYRGDPAVLKAHKAQQKAERSAIHSGIAKTKAAASHASSHDPSLKEARRKRTDEQLRRIQAGDFSAGSQPHKKKSSTHDAVMHAARAASPSGRRRQRDLDAGVNLIIGVEGMRRRLADD